MNKLGVIRFVAGLANGLLLPALLLVSSSAHAGVVGTGTALSCDQTALQAQLSAGGTVTFDCGGTATIAMTGPASVPANVTVDVDGGNQITLDGGGAHQIMSVLASSGPLQQAHATFRNITFANGYITGGLQAGGAIQNLGDLTVINTVFSGNGANGSGGAIFSEECFSCPAAHVTITNSSFTNNHANGYGGAVDIEGDFVTITGSTFSNNTASSAGAVDLYTNSTFSVTAVLTGNTFAGNTASQGGAIGAYLNNPGSSASLVSNTFYGNTGTTAGGALYVNDGNITLTNDTIAGNTSPAGAGIYVSSSYTAAVTIQNTLLSSNTGGGGNCSDSGSLISDGANNLQFGDNSCATFTVANPLLSALANNGGPTQTMALQAGSPAIDGGNNATCPATDQRGNARADGDNNGSVVCDIGAYEVAAIALVGSTAVPALSDWSLVILGLLLAGFGASRHRKASSHR